MRRLGYVRADHVAAIAANLRLTAIQFRAFDATIRRDVLRHPTVPVLNHDRMSRELQALGIDPAGFAMPHPNQAAWGVLVADAVAGVTLSSRLAQTADHLSTQAAHLAKNEARFGIGINGSGMIRLAQGSIDVFCQTSQLDLIIIGATMAWVCGPFAIAAPEPCAIVSALYFSIEAIRWWNNC
jgi:hypothetical protein